MIGFFLHRPVFASVCALFIILVFGAMIVSTVLNLFVVPVVYVALAGLRARLGRGRRTAAEATSNGHAPGAVPVAVMRTPDGTIVLTFADGSEPVRLTLPER